MFMFKKISAIVIGFFISLSLFTQPIFAVGLSDYFVLGKDDANGNKALKVADVYDTPAKLINTVVSNLMVIAGIIFFIMLIYAGFQYVKDNKKGPEEAKNILKVAITGFVIMLAAYWIIQIVEIVTNVQIFF